MHPQLGEDALQEGVDSASLNMHAMANFLVPETKPHQRHRLPFSWRQIRGHSVRRYPAQQGFPGKLLGMGSIMKDLLAIKEKANA